MMKQLLTYLLLLLCSVSFARGFAGVKDSVEWKELTTEKYTLHYTSTDQNAINKIDSDLRSGLSYIADYFHHSFINKLNVYVFPTRTLMDKQWQKDWGDSSFQSQCWMIASGVAHRLDILSPNAWTKEACEHNANDSTEIRQVVWHELVHVFHGQYNPDHTFSYIEKLDWLVEGLATYVSGQLDEKRLQRIKRLVKENKTPLTLDNFWKGEEKYGLSGSIVEYIDKAYGREKLFSLLKFTNKHDALKFLGLTEEQLLKSWKDSLAL
jgi:hypothetical protein